jgi:acyl dehydratase
VSHLSAQGPYFDELTLGQEFLTAPPVTLTSGLAAQHRAIVGDRLALALDDGLAVRVTGRSGLAHPALVWNVAIGQSTVATHHVKANLFYRGLAFHRFPHLGDTLVTETRVVGLRQNQRREGRAASGLAALHMLTRDQEGRTVLDFHRCAMLPLQDDIDTGHDDDLSLIGTEARLPEIGRLLDGWDTQGLPAGASPSPGDVVEVVGGDVVTSAPELARLTLNIAQVHHDARAAGGRRLVYGGHTIGIAAAQLARALPAVVAVTSWESCDHVGPVHEGDTLRSKIEVLDVHPVTDHPRLRLAELQCRVTVDGEADDRLVLDWRYRALLSVD